MPRDVIPAVAQTTSRPPSCSTPRSVAACTASVSRTSTTSATIRPPASDDQPGGLVEIGPRGGRNDDGVNRAADVERDDVGALLREPHRLRTPDAPRRTGDQRDLSLQSAHGHTFCVRPASTTSWVPVM